MLEETFKKVIERAKRFEGFRSRTYECSEGYPTIGYGTNLERGIVNVEIQRLLYRVIEYHINNGGAIGHSWVGLNIAEDVASTILYEDLYSHWAELGRNWTPARQTLPGAVQMVLADLAYNLGVSGVLKFKKTLAAIERGDWNTAADELLDSKYSKQVGRRATENADILRALA